MVTKGFDFLKGSVEAARESNAIAAQTAAVIKSTGAAANVTAKDVDNLSNAIARKTGVDDEQISKAQNLLLTFTGIRNEAGKNNDIFNQATKIAVDMGKALGTDASGSAIQLGKALNDPIKGITALTRVGVTFSDEQKKQIEGFVKTGKVAEAQKVILAELNKEFGGSAEAQATASDRLKVTLGNLQEDLGNKLVPIIDKAATVIADVLPAALDTAGRAAKALGDVFGPVVETLKPFFATLTSGFTEDEGTPIEEFALRIRSLGDTFRSVFESVRGFIEQNRPVFEAWAARIQEILGQLVGIFTTAFQAISLVVQGAIALILNMWDRFGSHIVEFLRTTVTNLVQVFSGALSIIQGILDVFVGVFTGDWSRAWEGVKGIFTGAAAVITGVVNQLINGIKTIVSVGMGAVSAAWGLVWRGMVETVKGILNQIIRLWNNTIGNLKFSVPSWVPGIGGKEFKGPRITPLAAGGIAKATPGGMLAQIAEGGKDEAVIPLPPGLIEGLQAIAAQARAGALGRGGGLTIGEMNITGTGDPETTARATIRRLRAEAWAYQK